MADGKRSTSRRSRKRRRQRARRGKLALIGIALIGVGTAAFTSRPFDAPSSQQLFAKAPAQHDDGVFAATVIELKNALRQDPGNTEIRILLGNAYMKAGNFAGAEKEFRRAMEFRAPANLFLEPLARALQLQSKHGEVLREIWPDKLVGEAAAEIYVARGRSYASTGEFGRAREAYRQALRMAPQHSPAVLEMSRLAIESGDFNAGYQHLRRFRALAPNDPEGIALQGDLYLKTERYSEAVEHYKRALKKLPGHDLTRVGLAEAYFRQGYEDETKELLDGVILRLPSNFDANYRLADIAYRNEDFETALKRAEQALRIDPFHLPSLGIAGHAAFALGQTEIAERNLKKFSDRVPDNNDAKELLLALRTQRDATIFRNRDFRRLGRSPTQLIDDTAEPALVAAAIDPTVSARQALEAGEAYLKAILSPRELGRSSDDAAIDFWAIRQLVLSPDAGKPIELLEQSHLDKPESRPALAFLAEAYNDGRTEEAYALVEKQLNRQVTNPEFLTVVAIAGLVTNRPDVARIALNELRTFKGPEVQIKYLLALSYDRLGNVASGAAERSVSAFALHFDTMRDELLKESLAIDPDYVPALCERARVALSRNRLDDAERDIKKLGELLPDHSEYLDLAAGLAMLRGQMSDAALLYRRAFEGEPTSSRALRLANAEHRSERESDSVAVLKNWLEQRPHDTTVARVLGDKYISSGQLVEAAEMFTNILRQRPNDIDAKNGLTWISLKLDYLADKETFTRQGLALAPSDVRLFETLADIHLATGKHEKALELLQRAIKQHQANPALQVKLARVLAQNGDRSQAVTVLREILDANNRFLDREDAERLLAKLEQGR